MEQLTNLDGVTDEETGPGHVVAGVVQEDKGHNGGGSRLAVVLDGEFGGDGPANEHDAHTTGRAQEERTTTSLVDSKSHGASDKHVPNVEAAVDQVLGLRVGDSNLREDICNIV